MTEQYDLSKSIILDSMHDQRAGCVELKKGELIFHFSELRFYEPSCEKAQAYYDRHKAFTSCDMVFKGVGGADLSAEVKTYSGLTFKGKIYYDSDFINFLNEHRYTVEMIDLYCGYRTVVIQAALVNERGFYCEERCTITITSDEVEYFWS